MPEQIAEKVLDHIPKKAPAWAIGITTVVVSVAMSLLSIYLFASTDIRQYLNWAEDHHNTVEIKKLEQHEIEDETRAKNYSDALDIVSRLVITNGTSLTDLAKSLGQTQQQNIALTERITTVEKEVSELRNVLVICQKALRECETKK